MHFFEDESDVNQYAKGLSGALHYLNEDARQSELKGEEHYLGMVSEGHRDSYDLGWIDGVSDFFARQ